MFSIFDKLFQITIGKFISISKINSPTTKNRINYGKDNIFVSQNSDIKSRSKGPYVLFGKPELYSKDVEWIRFNHEIVNLGSEPANNTETYTEIYIKDKLEFKSTVSASSIVPPDAVLDIRSQDPIELVSKCTHEFPHNRYVLVVEYDDLDGNKLTTVRACYFLPDQEILSTREEKVYKLPHSI